MTSRVTSRTWLVPADHEGCGYLDGLHLLGNDVLDRLPGRSPQPIRHPHKNRDRIRYGFLPIDLNTDSFRQKDNQTPLGAGHFEIGMDLGAITVKGIG